MPLFNRTKNLVIEKNVRIASSFAQQLKGLMFERKKKFDYALVFPMAFEGRFSSSIHCLFVFFQIDVVFLDHGKKVVDIRKSIPPFYPLCVPKKKAKYIVELSQGKSSGIEEGNELDWTV